MSKTPKWFKHGIPIICKIKDIQIKDAKLYYDGYYWFICQNMINGHILKNKLGYKYTWWIGEGKKEYFEKNGILVNDLKPKLNKEMLMQLKKEIQKC